MHSIFRLFFFVLILILSVNSSYADPNEELLDRAIALRQQGKLAKAAEVLNELAFYYWDNKKFEKAILTFDQVVIINKELNNEEQLRIIYSNIALVYSDMGDPETALLFFRKALVLSQQHNNPEEIAENLLNIGITLIYLHRENEAALKLEEALQQAQKTNNRKLLKNCYGKLATIYKRLGNNDKSVEYFSQFSILQEELQKSEIADEIKKSKAKISELQQTNEMVMQEKEKTEQQLIEVQDSLQKVSEINEENKLRLELTELVLRKRQAEKHFLIIIFATIIFFISAIAFLILIGYRQKRMHNIVLERRNQEIREQNEEIKLKSNKINQSINYAKSIQAALLPDIDSLKKLFKDSFVFFSPRDVVSGDFYWFSHVDVDRETGKGKILVAAVDCTGHGVPGALMSMLGISLFDDLVNDRGMREPAEILEQIHQMIKSRLNQDISGNSDGMDMGLFVLDENTRELTFDGAANPLVYIGDDKMEVLHPDIFGIGGQMHDTMKGFTQSKIRIEKPTIVYLFTDGFADQFGGEFGRKYFIRHLKELLFDIHKLPMDEQAAILEKKLKDWHGDEYLRVDDVLIMGLLIE